MIRGARCGNAASPDLWEPRSNPPGPPATTAEGTQEGPRLQQHAALAERVVAYTQLTAKTDPALVHAMLDHGLAAAAAPPDLITPEAREMLIRATGRRSRESSDRAPQGGEAVERVGLADAWRPQTDIAG